MTNNKTTFDIDKEKNFSEWYSEIVQKAEIADIRYGVKGFIVVRSWGARIMEKMYKLYESALQRTGHDPSFFPAVIPEENFKKEAGHVEGFSPQVFWLEMKQGEDKVALRPTGETEFYQMYSQWIRSYRDLPFKLYQRANVFRYETKATRPLIRGREFWWIEAHDCFKSSEEAENQVLEDIETTEAVMHQVFGVPFLPMKRPEWDKFPGAVYTIGSDSLLPDGKIIQQPSTHFLGQHFSKAFDVKYADEKEKDQYVWQTCYGPAISRILASVISVHGDNNGLILPYSISPYNVVIIPMHSKEKSKEINEFVNIISSKLFEERIDVKVDDSEKRVGEKFFYWEMKGVPFRMEIGEKEFDNKEITIFVRDTKEKIKIKFDKNLVEEIRNLGAEYDARLKKKADDFFYDRIVECKTKEEIKNTLDLGKIAKFNFCSVDYDGEKCAEIIEKEMNGEIRGVMGNKKEKAEGFCPFCGKKANFVVYAGKSY
jgi:prolyl-tRNA synthetase